ncbi:hypothetical protein [Desulfonatronovibrio magnus]|uniref:hypothetical protein n=1 Tax=Desulfonatronovibrio magnus TaxID=698827 RepID=UPI0005EBA528|nr:hypothetical protein [Desulfonatronovibrio magnus]
MSSHKYNVILMRDDTSVKRFRLSPFWIRFIVLIFLLLLSSTVAGGYYTYFFYNQYQTLKVSCQLDRDALVQANRELTRLQNISTMLESHNDEKLRSLLAQSKERPRVYSERVDLQDIFDLVDSGLVGITNVQARFVRDSMRVQLEVNNLDSGQTVSGRVHIFLVRNDGLMIDLNLEDRDLDFSINRFKSMDTTFELPEVMDQDTIFALRIKANDNEGQVLYSETYPLSHVLI